MNDIDRYLKQATRGLHGDARCTVEGELRASILELALDLRLGGLGEAEALHGAIRAFGPPSRVSRGMIRVHTLPILVKMAAFGTLALAALVTTVPRVSAQVSATTSATCTERAIAAARAARGGPVPPHNCASTSQLSQPNDAVNLAELAKVLREHGVMVTRDKAGRSLHIRFPGSTRDVSLRESFGYGGQFFIYNSSLLFLLVDSGLPVRLTSFTNPTITVGEGRTALRFSLGTEKTPVNGEELYTIVFSSAVMQHFAAGGERRLGYQPAYGVGQGQPVFRHVLHVDAPPNSVVGLATPRDRAGAHGMVFTDVGVVGQDGTVTLRSVWPRLTFTVKLDELRGDGNGAPPALLAVLTGQVGSAKDALRVVLPGMRTSEGVQQAAR